MHHVEIGPIVNFSGPTGSIEVTIYKYNPQRGHSLPELSREELRELADKFYEYLGIEVISAESVATREEAAYFNGFEAAQGVEDD